MTVDLTWQNIFAICLTQSVDDISNVGQWKTGTSNSNGSMFIIFKGFSSSVESNCCTSTPPSKIAVIDKDSVRVGTISYQDRLIGIFLLCKQTQQSERCPLIND